MFSTLLTTDQLCVEHPLSLSNQRATSHIQQPLSLSNQRATSHQSPVTSHQSPATSHQSPATSHQSPATSHQPPATSHQSPATSHQSPATSHQSPVTSHQSPVTSHQSPVTSHQSPVTSHQSPVTSHQSPVTSHIQQPLARLEPKYLGVLSSGCGSWDPRVRGGGGGGVLWTLECHQLRGCRTGVLGQASCNGPIISPHLSITPPTPPPPCWKMARPTNGGRIGKEKQFANSINSCARGPDARRGDSELLFRIG